MKTTTNAVMIQESTLIPSARGIVTLRLIPATSGQPLIGTRILLSAHAPEIPSTEAINNCRSPLRATRPDSITVMSLYYSDVVSSWAYCMRAGTDRAVERSDDSRDGRCRLRSVESNPRCGVRIVDTIGEDLTIFRGRCTLCETRIRAKRLSSRHEAPTRFTMGGA